MHNGERMNGRNKLVELIELAKEPSSHRRRDLLREVTDVFFVERCESQSQSEAYDAIFQKLSLQMEEAVRVELAERFVISSAAPNGLMRMLALDAPAVARPVLEQSPVLTEQDLLDVAKTRGQAHLRAMCGRSDLSERVTDAIVETADDDTLGVLARNDSAALSRASHEVLVDRAAQNPELHEAVVERESLPADLLNEMYFMVEGRLRATILARNEDMDPKALEEALSTSRKRLAAQAGLLPPDFAEAEHFIRGLMARKAVTPAVLVKLLRAGQRTHFILALAESTDIDFNTARRVIERQDLDALAILCKAADFDRSLFLTFAILLLDPREAMGRAAEYGQLYSELTKETAGRTLRFWRVRRETEGAVAA
jgi:uncharacterized protein (DUF2336 family)